MATTQPTTSVPDPGPPSPDTDGPPYSWPDLLARRNALGLRREDITKVLRVDVTRYWDRESGSRTTGAYLVGELIAMENFVAEQEAVLLTTEPQSGTAIVLNALIDQDEFTRHYPDARTRRDGVPFPAMLHDVALGRAAAELTRCGHTVEVYRGDRRADLTVRRLAAGLLKNETAGLFGMTEKKYYLQETGKANPSAGLLAELQTIDDFITDTALQLDVVDQDGVPVVLMIDDRARFEQSYPQAHMSRTGRRYPMRVHRVAAGRRAGMIERASGSARIAVRDD